MNNVLYHGQGRKSSRFLGMFTAFICAALLLAFLMPATVSAASVTVNSGQSIQSAINSAASGDVISIAPGTYNGSLSISKSITLKKAAGTSGEVIINGSGSSNVISVQNARVTIDGLSITNSTINGIILSGSGCNGSQIINCRFTNWGLRSATDGGTLCCGIYADGVANLLIQKNYMQRGTHSDVGTSESNYTANTMAWYGILIIRSSGGHQILDNELWGATSDGRHNLCDTISQSDWIQPDSSFNNSTIARNKILGGWDDIIQIDGNCVNVNITNNYIDGMGARALISTNPCYTGPINIKNNILKGFSQLGVKMGAFTGSANGTKYVDSNTFWNNGGYCLGGTNGSAAGVYFTNNKIYSGIKGISYGISFSQNSGNATSNIAEPTLSNWSGGGTTTPAPTPTPTPDPTTTPTPKPTPTPTPTPNGSTFGLNGGDNVWSDPGSALNAMRFQNTAGSGTLNQLEIQFNTSAPAGKVRLGVYADNAGKPGARLLDAGEATVANGWVAKSNLSLSVTANTYYWLAFVQSGTNGVAFLSSGSNTTGSAHYWTNCTYGALPASFNLTGSGNNQGPYVMRATVSTAGAKTFGLNSGDSTWGQSSGILDVMRFQNNAGTGTLNKLELLVADSTPSGKVRFGIYADSNGKPGKLLLNAGEATVINGWVSVSNLNLQVTTGTYYWLAFGFQNGNTARYQSGQTANSHYWINQSYGTMPGAYPTTGLYVNTSPYVMRATVAVK